MRHLPWISILLGILIGLGCCRAAKAADTWYLRPASWAPVGDHDGTSYDTAWDGFSDVNWVDVQPGDTIYICDTWVYGTDFGYQGNAISDSGTPGNVITVRGDLADHAGVLIGSRKYASGSWTDNGDGTYKYDTMYSDPKVVWQGDPTGTPDLLKYVDINDVNSTDGSWAFVSDGQWIFVNPWDDPGMEDIYAGALGSLYISSQEYLTISNLSLFGGPVSVSGCSNLTIEDCEIAFDDYTAIYAGASTSNILIEDCVLHDVPTGTYTQAGVTSSYSHSDWTMRRVEVYSGRDTGNFYSATTSDRHALGGQNLRNWLVEYCYIHDWAGDGILNYSGSAEGTDCSNVVIRYNRIDNLNDDDDQNYHWGIVRNGTNSGDWATINAGWEVYGNVISNLGLSSGAAIRIKGPGGSSDIWPKIYNNTIYDCRIGLSWIHIPNDPNSGFDFRNNIVCSPKTGGYHVYLESCSGTKTVVMANNCWYPDTSGGNNLFAWDGGARDDFADWVADALSEDGVTIGTNSTVSDPKLTDPSNGDMSLDSGSAAEDAGVKLGFEYDDGLDLDNTTWPDSVVLVDRDNYDAAWDIGADVNGTYNGTPTTWYVILRRQ